MAGANDAVGNVTVVSKNAAGVGGNHQSRHPVFSPDGKRVIFESSADNLVPGDTNHAYDLFSKDLATGAVTLISATVKGVQGDSDSTGAVLSRDGTKVAFVSFAGNLVSNDADIYADVFVKNLVTGEVTMVSSDANGAPAVGGGSSPTFAADGNKVAFVTSAALAAGDTNGRSDIYLKDLTTGALTRLSTDSAGNQIANDSTDPVLSADGSKLVFRSYGALTPDARDGVPQIYVKNLTTGTVTLVSRAANNPDGTPGAVANSGVDAAVLSPDGTKVAFWSRADNLVAGDSNGDADLFVKDLVTGTVTIATAAQDGTQGRDGGNDELPTFSPDGTKLLFSAYGNYLVPGDTNNAYDLFEKDLVTGVVTRVSTAADGSQARSNSLQGVWSPDGSKIAFLSGANNLVPGFTPAEGDIFLKTLTVALPPNSPPVAADDAYLSMAGTPFAVKGPGILANDHDVNGDALTAMLVDTTQHGKLTFDSAGGFTYLADAGFHGQDRFTYKASDGQSQSGLATVTLTVDTPPVAADDRYTTRQNMPLAVAAGSGLLANDRDADGDHLSAGLISGPAHGTLDLKADGSFIYTPTTGYVGSDSFTYRDSDGIVPGNVATVSLGVTANFGDIVRVSTDSGDGQIERGGNNPTLSPDGTKVAFWSSSIYAGDGGGSRLYIKDLTTRTATAVWQETTSDYRSSIAFSSDNRTIAFDSSTGFQIEDTLTGATSTLPHTGAIRGARFSPNGSQIAFYTDASLMPGDTNGQVDVYILDRPTSSLNRVSTAGDGSQGVRAGAIDLTNRSLSFSSDGNRIVFSSALRGLTTDRSNGFSQAFIKDLKTGEIRQLTHGDHDPVLDLESATYVDGSIFGANSNVTSTVLSPDGTKIAFVSQASNLLNGVTTSPDPIFGNPNYIFPQIFVQDLATGTVTVASSTPDGIDAVDSTDAYSGPHLTAYPVFSSDSQKIAFRSSANNLVPNDTNKLHDVFVKDLTTGAIIRVNTTVDGAQTFDSPDRLPSAVSFSPDGSKILFSSEVDNFVAGDTNDAIDVFLKTIRYTPTAVDDRWAPYSYQPLVIDASRGVLANDISPSGSALTATLVSGPAHGTLDFHADGSFSYTDGFDPANPSQYYFGEDDFTYKVSDGISESGTATVHLYVVAPGGGGLWGFGGGIGGSSGLPPYRGHYLGDPHLQSFDGRAYDFQAVGEFTLARGPGLEIQVRQQAVAPNVSSDTALAMKIGGSVVEIDADTAHPLRIDGTVVDLADGTALTVDHGVVSRGGNVYTLVNGNGDGVSVGVSTFLNLLPFVGAASSGQVSGLLGNADGNPSNDLVLADGTALTGEVSPQTLHGAFADSWRVNDATSLFTYAPGQSTASFTDRSSPAKVVTLADLDPAARAAGEQAARAAGLTEGTLDFANAVLDVALTGNAEYATAAAGIARAEDGPAAPGLALTSDTGASASDGITRDAHLTVTPAESGGTLSYFVDGKAVASYDPASLAQGAHTVLVNQTDAQGHASVATSLSFTLDSVAPTPSLTSVSGATNTVAHVLSGSVDMADASTTITVFDGTSLLGSVISDSSGHFSLPFAFSGDGPGHAYQLTATQTDLAGNIGTSAPFSFDLDFTGNQLLFGTLAHDLDSPGGEAYAFYDALLGRVPDATGLESWAAQIVAGVSLRDVAASFLASPEFAAAYGGPAGGGSDNAFVQHLYQSALGRAPDAPGEAMWESRLAAGASRADVALTFALSPENQDQIAPALNMGVFVPDPAASEIARLYHGLLGRAPDAGGLQTWETAYRQGTTWASIADGFLASPEYAAVHSGAQTDRQYVDDLYQDVLGRTAEPAGESAWLADLATGRLTRGGVAIGITDSFEAHSHLDGRIEQGWHLA